MDPCIEDVAARAGFGSAVALRQHFARVGENEVGTGLTCEPVLTLARGLAGFALATSRREKRSDH